MATSPIPPNTGNNPHVPQSWAEDDFILKLATVAKRDSAPRRVRFPMPLIEAIDYVLDHAPEFDHSFSHFMRTAAYFYVAKLSQTRNMNHDLGSKLARLKAIQSIINEQEEYSEFETELDRVQGIAQRLKMELLRSKDVKAKAEAKRLYQTLMKEAVRMTSHYWRERYTERIDQLLSWAL